MKETIQPHPPLKPLPMRYIVIGLIVLAFCCVLVFFGVVSSYEMHKTHNLRQMIKDFEKAEAEIAQPPHSPVKK